MQTLAEFFESINSWLGVESGLELVFNPYFLGLSLAAFLYAVIKGWKYLACIIAGMVGTAVIINYLFPQDTTDLIQLVKFVGACGGLAIVLIYVGFIRGD
jgi:hypothetical protein